jgi:cation diffusion facilitator family transporter
MHTKTVAKWQHTHIFGQDQITSGERRTLTVIIITAAMMVIEIVAGIMYGSMALTADGIHMGSHMVGLGISFMAFNYARKYANDQRFSFGTGKVNALAGFSSAMILVGIALFMGYESVVRIVSPVTIEYDLAIFVAVIGLLVNGASMLILGEKGHTHAHGDESRAAHDHSQDHDHGHDHGDHDHGDHDRGLTGTGEDHNLKAAYLHVLTDAMTSVLAIIALLVAKYWHLVWMDPVVGILGAILVIRWSAGLIQGTTKVLLDHQIPEEVRERVTGILESYKDTKVCDLHIWCIGPGIYSSEISVVTKYPDSPNKYKTLIPRDTGIVHSTFEVHLCAD